MRGTRLGRIDLANDTRMSRRALLSGALATATAAAFRPVLAQQTQTHMPLGMASRAKGPLVFLDYDQDEIDAAYTQASGRLIKQK